MGDRADPCAWGYGLAIKNVAMVMVVLMVLSIVFSLVRGNFGGALTGIFAGAIFILPILISMVPMILVVTATRNALVCGKL